MAGFVLFDPTMGFEVDSARELFLKKGMNGPSTFDLGGLRLELWRKALIEKQNYISGVDKAIFSVGTPVYRGLGYRQSLRAVLKDQCAGRLDWERLRGSFVLLIWSEGGIQILLDRLSVQSLFVAADGRLLSTSFLATLVALPGTHEINRLAFSEKVATGYVVPPDTLVEGIERISGGVEDVCNKAGWRLIRQPRRKIDATTKTSRMSCIEDQVSGLKSYFEDIRCLGEEYGSILGLSGGYDSRLLAAAAKSVSFRLSYQTHLTKGMDVHSISEAIVREIARINGEQLLVIPTNLMRELTEPDFEKVARNSLLFFDGRNSHNMGSYSEVYTSDYSARSLGTARLRLNGLGGEVFRNYYYSSLPKVSCLQWMVNHVYYGPAREVIGSKEVFRSMHENKMKKMSRLLDIDYAGTVGEFALKRYYSEIRMPFCDGANNNAHDQIGFYLTPYIDWEIIRRAYGAIRHHGVAGGFEAELLAALSPALAGVHSLYGFPFDRKPFRHFAKAAIKGYVPDIFWNVRRKVKIRSRAYDKGEHERFESARTRYKFMSQVQEMLAYHFPTWNWGFAYQENAMGQNVFFLGSFLHEFAHKLKRS